MSTTDNNNNNNNDDLDILLLSSPDEEDYYTNPLVSSPSKVIGDDELTKMIKALVNSSPPPPSSTTTASANAATIASSPLINLQSSSDNNDKSYVGDPFYFEGKLVKFARFFISNVELSQGSSWPGYQDYYEQGRLMGFSITCNDPDIIPICLIENGSGSKDVINDMSFKEATIHGRGMTYAEATSTVRTADGLTSRDVSGTPGTLFPHVIRYKDQFTGTGVYNDIKNTVDDKAYVMNFEPSLFIPYQRLYFDVFNGSQIGNKLINRLEIKRLVYVTPDQISTNAGGNTSELTQFNQNLLTVYDKMNNLSGTQLTPPVTPPTQGPQLRSNFASAAMIPDRLYEDWIRYQYQQLMNRDAVKMDLTGKKTKISSQQELVRMRDLMNMASDNNINSIKPKLNKKNYIDDNNNSVLRIKWD